MKEREREKDMWKRWYVGCEWRKHVCILLCKQPVETSNRYQRQIDINIKRFDRTNGIISGGFTYTWTTFLLVARRNGIFYVWLFPFRSKLICVYASFDVVVVFVAGRAALLVLQTIFYHVDDKNKEWFTFSSVQWNFCTRILSYKPMKVYWRTLACS